MMNPKQAAIIAAVAVAAVYVVNNFAPDSIKKAVNGQK